MATSDILDAESPLLNDVVRSSVDFKGRPAVRSNSGGWKSASFIIGVEMAERFAYYGISSNLITYLTGPLGQSTAAAAANVNAWSGTAFLSPLVGAFIADSFLGKYRSIIISSVLYIMGLGFLTVSAAFTSISCKTDMENRGCSVSHLQVAFFFFSLYLIALSQGGHKPCIQAFGAHQFDLDDDRERRAKSSFFNWWNFYLSTSVLVGLLVLSYIQDNLSWELGFGIPCIVMCFSLTAFLLGSFTYRFPINPDQRNPFVRISRVFVESAKNRLTKHDSPVFVEKACSTSDVEDAKAIRRLVPIWITCLTYAIVYAQSTTLFTKQGATMDRNVTKSFRIPSAALQSFTPASLVVFIPIYDRVLVPVARAITKTPSGISMLQRVGAGMFLSVVSMVVAAIIERKRLEKAREHGLVDLPGETVPMSVWWLGPQLLILGIGDVLTLVGIQEFVYDEFPGDLKSMGFAVCLGVVGSGSLLSSLMISVIDKATSGKWKGGESWFSDNLNRAHLDYFYWLLAGLSAFSFAFYVYFANSYVHAHKLFLV